MRPMSEFDAERSPSAPLEKIYVLVLSISAALVVAYATAICLWVLFA